MNKRLLCSLIMVVFIFSSLNPFMFNTKTYSLPVVYSQENFSAKLLAHDGEVFFLLNAQRQEMMVYDSGLRLLHRWRAVSDDETTPVEYVSMCFWKGHIYLLDVANAGIRIFDRHGTDQGVLEGAAVFLTHPTAMTIMNDQIYVAQDNYLWVFDELGYLLEMIEIVTNSSSATPLICSMASDSKQILLADQANHQVMVFDGRSFSHSGSYGTEAGQFQIFSGMALDGNHLVLDSLQNRIHCYHPAFNYWSYLPEYKQMQVQAADILVHQDTLYLASYANDRLFSLPLNKTTEGSLFFLSTTHIDLGIDDIAGRTSNFSIISRNGFPIQGTVSCDHPGIVVSPSSFHGSLNVISFRLNAQLIPKGAVLQEKIIIRTIQGETQEIDLRYQRDTRPSIIMQSHDFKAISDTVQRVRLSFQSQNALEGTFKVSVTDLSDSFDLKTSTEELVFLSNRLAFFEFEALPRKKMEAGLYPFQIALRSDELKMQRQYVRYLAYAPSDKSVDRKVVSELFTATWCGYCPSAEKAHFQLYSEYAPDQLSSLSYYMACLEEGSDSLCNIYGQERASYYRATGTPVLILDGMLRKDGGIASQEESMIQEYRPMLEQRLHQRSTLSMHGSALLDTDSKELFSRIRLSFLDIQPQLDDLRLFVALVEKKVYFTGKNRQEEHHQVVRWMDDVHGTVLSSLPIMKENLGTIAYDSEQVLPFIIEDTSQWEMVAWLQDQTNREILQSKTFSLHTQLPEAFVWHNSTQTIDFVSETPTDRTFHFTYLGESLGRYRFSSIFNGDNETASEEWYIRFNGKEHLLTESFIAQLLPGESVDLKLHLPDLPSMTAELILSATSLITGAVQTAHLHLEIKEVTSCKLELRYPEQSMILDVDSIGIILKIPQKLMITSPSNAIHLKQQGLVVLPLRLHLGENEALIHAKCADGESTELRVKLFKHITIQLQIAETRARINRRNITMDAAPFLLNNRTMVPLRFIAESFSCEVTYDAQNRAVEITFQDQTIRLQIDSKKVLVNGVEAEMDVPAIIHKQRTFVPLRFISEFFGARVEWVAATQEIILELP